MRDRKVADRPKNVFPGVPPGQNATRTPSGSSGRRVSRFQRWLNRRLDRLADRMRRRRERLAARSARLTLGGRSRRRGVAFRLRRRWYLVIDRVELVLELMTVRWYRFVSRIPDLWPRRARGRTSHRGALVAAGLSVAIAVTAIAVLLEIDAPGRTEAVSTDGSPTPEPSTAPSTAPSPEPSPEPGGIISPGPSFELSTYTNEQSGYLFTYPNDWDVSTSGSAAVLSDPEGQVVISFDRAQPGSLEQASDQVLEQLAGAYVTPQTIATENDLLTPEDYPSIAVGGTAMDASGAPIRFLAITIQGPDENRTLLVRFPAVTDPDDLGAILGVVGSFRIDDPAA